MHETRGSSYRKSTIREWNRWRLSLLNQAVDLHVPVSRESLLALGGRVVLGRLGGFALRLPGGPGSTALRLALRTGLTSSRAAHAHASNKEEEHHEEEVEDRAETGTEDKSHGDCFGRRKVEQCAVQSTRERVEPVAVTAKAVVSVLPVPAPFAFKALSGVSTRELSLAISQLLVEHDGEDAHVTAFEERKDLALGRLDHLLDMRFPSLAHGPFPVVLVSLFVGTVVVVVVVVMMVFLVHGRSDHLPVRRLRGFFDPEALEEVTDGSVRGGRAVFPTGSAGRHGRINIHRLYVVLVHKVECWSSVRGRGIECVHSIDLGVDRGERYDSHGHRGRRGDCGMSASCYGWVDGLDSPSASAAVSDNFMLGVDSDRS